jgi:hypothetical protein
VQVISYERSSDHQWLLCGGITAGAGGVTGVLQVCLQRICLCLYTATLQMYYFTRLNVHDSLTTLHTRTFFVLQVHSVKANQSQPNMAAHAACFLDAVFDDSGVKRTVFCFTQVRSATPDFVCDAISYVTLFVLHLFAYANLTIIM